MINLQMNTPLEGTVGKNPLRHIALLFIFMVACIATVYADDLGDGVEFAHAMEVQTKRIDDLPVVFHYGQVRPEFLHEVASPTRVRQVLNNGWKFRFDPNGEGGPQNWAKASLPAGNWHDITVPHCWDMMPGGRFYDWKDRSPTNPPHYDGAAWYRLEIVHTPRPGKHHRLEFLGVQQRARIFLNGREIALHEGGGQPFSTDVTRDLLPGKNLLALKVIRRPNHQPMAPGGNKEPPEIDQIHGPHPKAPDNWPYAGITREVALITENPATVRKTLLRTQGAVLEAAVIVSNSAPDTGNFAVGLQSTSLADPIEPVTVEVPAGGVRVVRFAARLKDGAARWSPEKPALQTVKISLAKDGTLTDEWQGSFGIRSFTAKNGRFQLNGQPVFLKGVAMYEETRLRGAALRPEDHKQIFQQCRETGSNFIRLQVNQRSPLVYQMADRLGFMLTGEWGGFWYREKAMDAQTRDPKSIFQSHARCAIWDLMNRPSVVLWCSHNESHQFCPEYEKFVAKGTAIVRELDWQNRPVTWAAWHPQKGQPHFEHADAVGFNEYRGAMDPFEKLDPDMRQAAKDNPGKPLIILENGAWARPGKRGKPDESGTEEWQADLLRRQHEVLTRHIPPLAGYTYWILTDYRSRKFYTANRDSDGYSAMGLYGPSGEVKLVRDVFRRLSW